MIAELSFALLLGFAIYNFHIVLIAIMHLASLPFRILCFVFGASWEGDRDDQEN